MAPRVASIGLLPHQSALVDDETSKIICLTAGVGSGKTRGAVWKALRLAYVNAPHAILVVLPTYRQLTSVFVETWAQCMAQAGVRYHYHRSNATIEFTMGGRLCKLLLRSGDNAESLYGLNVAAALIDEWETMSEEIVRVIRERIRDGNGSVNQLALFGTPEGTSGFGAKWCEDADAIGMRQIIARTSDNWHLKQSYVDDLTAMMSEGEIQARLNGIRTAKTGRVYTRFDKAKHHLDAPKVTYKDLPQIQMWCDFNVDAMTWGVAIKRDNECHIIDEILGSKNGTDVLEHGEYARSRIALLCGTSEREVMQAKVKVVCDAAGQQRSSNSNLTAVQILRSLGFDVRFPSSNPSIEASVQSVQLALAKGRIKIDTKKCRYITRCLEQQGYDKTTGKPEKLKGEADLSHGCLVAGTMIETSTGERPIESIVAGDKVLTRYGYKTVTASTMTQENADVYRVNMSNGRSLTGTADHPVWVAGKGFVRLDSIRYGDNLIECKNQNRFTSKEPNSPATQNQKGERTASTLVQGMVDCIARFGSTLTGKYPMGTTSTTSTATHSTTPSTTLNASLQKNTPTTIDMIQSHGQSARWLPQERPLRFGIAARLVESGILKTRNVFSHCVKALYSIVNAVESNLLHAGYALRSKDFAATHANRNGAGMPALMMSRANASSVGPSSCTTNTTAHAHAQSPAHALGRGVYVGKQAVYNLSVDGAPEYFASGVLVHNCDLLRYGVHMYWPGFSTRANEPVPKPLPFFQR